MTASAPVVEIIEWIDGAVDENSPYAIPVVNDVRINGVSILCSDDPVIVHEISTTPNERLPRHHHSPRPPRPHRAADPPTRRCRGRSWPHTVASRRARQRVLPPHHEGAPVSDFRGLAYFLLACVIVVVCLLILNKHGVI